MKTQPSAIAGLILALAPLGAAAQLPQLTTELVGDDFEEPLLVTAPPGDPRLFVVEQIGRIWIVAGGAKLAEPFLDIADEVAAGGEQGLLGLAFHPDYAANGRFFVNYTDREGDSRTIEYLASADPDRAAEETASLVLHIDDPADNHNGGWLAFGPDGYLYLGMGDGGGGGDPFQTGQDPNTLLAKILRLDVDSARPYAIPPDNPFAQGGGAPEVWLWGLRNPWRADFDGNDLYIADVGQQEWEEVSVVTMADGGANLGWSVMEGNHCFRGSTCDPSGYVLPVYEFEHPYGCSITGGYVYRGQAIPELAGHYFFGDYCAGFVRSFRYDGAGGITEETDWTQQIGDAGHITSFGEDAAGELYITAADGRVFKIVRR